MDVSYQQTGSGTQLFTSHGTVIFVDPASGELRHGPPAGSPSNVVLVREGEQARIRFVDANGQQDIVFLPEYSAVIGSDKAAAITFGSVFSCAIVLGKEFGLNECGKFLCAEPDGRITLSRFECNRWERFHTRTYAGLESIFHRWGTDKVRNGYADFYECLFRKGRLQIESVLEIGIGTMIPGVHSTMFRHAADYYKPGGSLRSWREFFPNATIYGIDVQPDTQFDNEPRILTSLCDSTDGMQVDRYMRSIKHRKFDIIIDDGSHTPNDQLATLQGFFEFLKADGTYVIEDIAFGGQFHHLDKIRAVCGDNPFFFAGPQNNPLVITKRSQTEIDDRCH
jgi:hypothetical protein